MGGGLNIFGSESSSSVVNTTVTDSYGTQISKAINIDGIGDIAITLGGDGPSKSILTSDNLLPALAIASATIAAVFFLRKV